MSISEHDGTCAFSGGAHAATSRGANVTASLSVGRVLRLDFEEGPCVAGVADNTTAAADDENTMSQRRQAAVLAASRLDYSLPEHALRCTSHTYAGEGSLLAASSPETHAEFWHSAWHCPCDLRLVASKGCAEISRSRACTTAACVRPRRTTCVSAVGATYIKTSSLAWARTICVARVAGERHPLTRTTGCA